MGHTINFMKRVADFEVHLTEKTTTIQLMIWQDPDNSSDLLLKRCISEMETF